MMMKQRVRDPIIDENATLYKTTHKARDRVINERVEQI